MNYKLFADWVRERVEDLVEMGVPRAAAEHTMHYVEITAINAETAARKDDQLLLDFKILGGRVLAERMGISERTVRERRARILRQKTVYTASALQG